MPPRPLNESRYPPTRTLPCADCGAPVTWRERVVYVQHTARGAEEQAYYRDPEPHACADDARAWWRAYRRAGMPFGEHERGLYRWLREQKGNQ